MEFGDVEEAAVGDLEFGDDGEGHEGEGHEGGAVGTTELMGFLLESEMGLGDLAAGMVGHESATLELEAVGVLSVDNTKAAANLYQLIDGLDDVLVGHADGDDVVAVVGDGAGDGSALEPEAVDEADGWRLG